MNVKQLAFVNLLSKWCKGDPDTGVRLHVDASYAVLGKELGVTPVAVFLRTKTLEKQGWVRRRQGKLYLHPQFSGGSVEEYMQLPEAPFR